MTSLHLYHFAKRRSRVDAHTHTNFAGNWANYKDHEKTFSITFMESVNNTKAVPDQITKVHKMKKSLVDGY